MPPHLIKLTIPKHTYASRQAVCAWLREHALTQYTPPGRCDVDALRIARTYEQTYHPDTVASHSVHGEARQRTFGLNHLFDNDMRRLAYTLVEDDVDPLWHGLWLCLTHAPNLGRVAELDRLTVEGSVMVRTLLLADRQANRATLAEALSALYREQLTTLAARLQTPRPTIPAIEVAYAKLCVKLRRAEDILNMKMGAIQEQIALEKALVVHGTNKYNSL